jgi:hypothetical protein
MWVKRLIPWVIRGWPVLVLVLVFALGAMGGRQWFPRIVNIPVDRVIWWTVKDQLPGKVTTLYKMVPGPAGATIKVPFEVIREVPGLPGPERIVTVTVPVDVPVEVIRREWPQTITVRVGGVLSRGQWHIPDYPDLTIGQVTLGAYAVSSQMLGWRIERVTTETQVPDKSLLGPRPLPNFTVHPLAGEVGANSAFLGPMVHYQNWLNEKWVYHVGVRWDAVAVGAQAGGARLAVSVGLPYFR